MPQISKGDTFANGQQVDALRLNQLVDSAVVLSGVITEQTALTANTVASDDSALLFDQSANALRKTTVGSVLNSNLPISTSSITGGAGVDIVLTPASGREVDIAGNFQVIGNSITTGNSSTTGNSTVGGNLTLTGQINGTGAIRVSSGTTAERPASPVAGSFRFNTTTNTLEVHNGTDWITTAAVYNNLPVYGVFEFVTGAGGFAYVASGTLGGHTGSKWQTTSTVSKTNKEYWELNFNASALLSDIPEYGHSYTIKLIGSNGVVYATKTQQFQFQYYTYFNEWGNQVSDPVDDRNRQCFLSLVLDTSVVFSNITLAIVITTSVSPTVSRVNPTPTNSPWAASGGVYTIFPDNSSWYVLTNSTSGKKWAAP